MELTPKTCRLQDSELFAGLSEDLRRALKDQSPPKTVKKSEFIAQQGEKTGKAYFLCRGRVIQTRVNSYGRSTIVSILTEGMLLGISSQILNIASPFSFKAIADCCVHPLETSFFLEILGQNPSFRWKVVEQLSQEELRAKEELSNCRGLQGRQNVASLLQILSREFGREREGGIELAIHLSRVELAEMCGISTEALVRILSSFRSEGIIRNIDGKKLMIADPAALAAIIKKV